ncbi:MAG: hypothetical protein ABI876_16220, partial [Bacteroidota bacterium]
FRGSTERLGAHTFKASAIVEPDHGVVGGEIGWWADAFFCGGLNLGYFISDSRNATVFRLDVGLSLGPYRVVYGWNFYTAPPLIPGINSSELSLMIFFPVKTLR